MGKGKGSDCKVAMDAQVMIPPNAQSAPGALLETLKTASKLDAQELLGLPRVDSRNHYGRQLKGWLGNLQKNPSASRRYFPAVNFLNAAYPDWYKERGSYRRGLEMLDILFQDGAAATRYQNTGSGSLVWTSDSAATAWGYYGLSLGKDKITPNRQVSWAGSRRLDPDKLLGEVAAALKEPGPTFIDALRSAPSKTLAQSASFPDGSVSPREIAAEDIEWAIRMQNAERLADKADLTQAERQQLIQAASALPAWGLKPGEADGPARDIISKLQIGKSPDGYTVVEAPESNRLAGLLADSWRAWVVSEQADRISEAQRKALKAEDNWDWVERTRQTAWRSRWDSPEGRELFARKAQGQIETRYRMLHTIYAGISRDKMLKKEQAEQKKGDSLQI